MYGDRLKMGSWKDIKKLISYSKGDIISKTIIHGFKPDSTLFCMGKGSELSKHTSRHTAMIYVVEGKGMFILEGNRIIMRPGIIIFMNKNAVHSLRADTNMSFILALY
jgi:quercetin dioxygenase-like cupin family protein